MNENVLHIFYRSLHNGTGYLGRNRIHVHNHFSINLKSCDVACVKKVLRDKFSPSAEVTQVCIHIHELLDSVNNHSTVDGFTLDDVKAMLGALCEN